MLVFGNLSPKPLAKLTLFAKLVGDALLEVPEVAPFELFDLAIASFWPMAPGYDPALDGALWRAQVKD